MREVVKKILVDQYFELKSNKRYANKSLMTRFCAGEKQIWNYYFLAAKDNVDMGSWGRISDQSDQIGGIHASDQGKKKGMERMMKMEEE